MIKEDDPKKAKNCLYLGIILTVIWIAFSVVSGAMLASEMENFPFSENGINDYNYVEVEESGNLTPEELDLLYEGEINEIMQTMPYDYEVFGFDIVYLQLQNEEGVAVTEFNKNEKYSIISEIKNTDDFEKNIFYTIGMISPPISFEEFNRGEMTVPAFGTVTVSQDNMAITIAGNYKMGVEVIDVDKVEQAVMDLNDSDIPGWRSYSEIVNLKESQ